jgi:hypothetical protein
MEVAVIVVVFGLPKLPAQSLTFAAVLPALVLGLSTVAIASPSAHNHAHDAHGGHGDEDGHVHATTAAEAAGAAGAHDHTVTTDQVASLAAGHTHPDDFKPYEPMDVATFKQLGDQLAQARELTLRYPTVADATAAGFVRRGSFMPGQGAHYFPPPDLVRAGNSPLERPLAWLFAGTGPTSPVVGLMFGAGTDFAGPNDRFHYHDDVCVSFQKAADGSYPTLSEAEGITAADCRAKGGTYIAKAGPLMHVWAVPGWESPIGVFSHDNPLVACTDGQKPADVTQGKGGCQGLA